MGSLPVGGIRVNNVEGQSRLKFNGKTKTRLERQR